MGLTWSSYAVADTEVLVLVLVGELTRGTAGQLEAQLAHMLARTGSILVIDLAAVNHCDRAGLDMIEACQRTAVVAGVVMRLAAPSPAVSQALDATGLADVLAVFRSVDAASRHRAAERD